jgi:DAACS family dicarboxylate/amino acid:cation (Na+ or H+) symporter
MWYLRLPLVAKILIGAVIGGLVGWALGGRAESLKPVSDLVLQLLTLLATPLIFLGLFHAVLTATVRGRLAGRLAWVMVSNSIAAALIGLIFADLIAPGSRIRSLTLREFPSAGLPSAASPLSQLLDRIPRDLVNPFATNDVLGVVVLAIAFALALRTLRLAHSARIDNVAAYANLGLQATIRILHWVFELIPIAVLAVVTRIVGTTGLTPLAQMAWFVLAVLIALAVTAIFYALRLRLSTSLRPADFVSGASDALLLAFSTASSAATLPVTYECAVTKLGVSEEAASLGVMAGGPLNHDGGALYQVVSALCLAQAIRQPLGFGGQALLIGIAVVASICTAGIPQAGLISMVAVFRAVHLPVEWIPFLLPVDWFLDRCRTTINVAGNLVATCIGDTND